MSIEEHTPLPYLFDLLYDFKTVESLHAHLMGTTRFSTSATDRDLVNLMSENDIPLPEGYESIPDAAGNSCLDMPPVQAARVLAALKGDEVAIIEAFRELSHGERSELGLALASFASVLCMESKFQPVLLAERIKIPISSFEEGLAVQEALFKLGCGFHNGCYPLTQQVYDDYTLSGVFVSPKGVMSAMPNARKEDREYVQSDGSRAVSVDQVLQATSPSDLLK